MDQIIAEEKLKKIFHFQRFYGNQWKTIDLLFKGKRVLLIEKTGFGKSLCYQFPATQLVGLTIVFTPLISLMRDQVQKMKALGIKAECINSNQESSVNEQIIEQAKQNTLKLLYIAPERMENIEWMQTAKDLKIAMVVIDEAHCISTWGHSFRPNYRRIVKLVNLLPKTFPVLATTATATKFVEEDIKKQIGYDMISIRGELMRKNLKLGVVNVKSEEEKLAWLAKYINKFPGTGVIYTGTQSETVIYSKWLQYLHVSAAAYNASLDADSRISIECALMNNTHKCVVSTNAMGMGIDKPDIRFIIHTQIPQSPIHYYQEIGRAGRDGIASYVILLFNENNDLELPRSFIENLKPSLKKYHKVIEACKTALMGRNEIINYANIKQTQANVILEDLIDQGIVNIQITGRTKQYFYNRTAKELDISGFESLRRHQLDELQKMIEYVHDSGCRMKYLCNYLGDDSRHTCQICDNDTGNVLTGTLDKQMEEKIKDFRETFFPVLEVQTQRSRLINGVAASYYGMSSAGQSIHKSKYENGGDFPDWLLSLTLKAFRKSLNDIKFDLLLYAPSTTSGDLVKNFARKIGAALKIPVSDKLVKSRQTDQQKIFQSAISKRENVKDAFFYENAAELRGKRILLFDDIFDSGATVKEIGLYLTRQGADLIAPLTIAKTVGGDLS